MIVPDHISNIWSNAFANKPIISVVLPDKVKYVGEKAFSGCKMLESIRLSANMEEFEKGMFKECCRLRSIFLPAKINTVFPDAFLGCSALTELQVAPENEHFSARDGMLLSKDGADLYLCVGAREELAVPEGVSKLHLHGLIPCIGLKRVVVPEGVELSFNKALYEGQLCVTLVADHYYTQPQPAEVAAALDPEGLNPKNIIDILLVQKAKDWHAFARKGITSRNADEVMTLLTQAIAEKKKLAAAQAKLLAEDLEAVAPQVSAPVLEKLCQTLCEKAAVKPLLEEKGLLAAAQSGGGVSAKDAWVHSGEVIVGVQGEHASLIIPDSETIAVDAFAAAKVEKVCISKKNTAITLAWLSQAVFSDDVKTLEVSPNWLAGLINKEVGFKTPLGNNPKVKQIVFGAGVKQRISFAPEKVNSYFHQMMELSLEQLDMDPPRALAVFGQKMSPTVRMKHLDGYLTAMLKRVGMPSGVDAAALQTLAEQAGADEALPHLVAAAFGTRMQDLPLVKGEGTAPAAALEYLLLRLISPERVKAEVDCPEMDLLALADKKALQAYLQGCIEVEDKGTSTVDVSGVLPVLCRLCNVPTAIHLMALAKQYARKADVLSLESARGAIRHAVETYLPCNRDPDVLIAVDKRLGLERAAWLRGINVDDLRTELLCGVDELLDETGSILLHYGPRSFTATLQPDMTFVLLDNAKNKEIKSLPKPNKQDDAQLASDAAASLKALKENVKSIAGRRLQDVTEMLYEGKTQPYAAWKRVYTKSFIVRMMARGILWGVYAEGDELLVPFRIDPNGVPCDVNGAPVGIADTAMIGVVDAAQLTEDQLAAWRSVFWKEEDGGKAKKSIVRQFECPVRYVTGEHLENRYMGLTVTVGYASTVLGYNPYSREGVVMDGNFIEVGLIPQKNSDDLLEVDELRVQGAMPAYADMSCAMKRLFNRDLIRLDSVLHPEKKTAEIVSTGTQDEVVALVKTHMITADNVLQMINVAAGKAENAAYLLQCRQEWLGDLVDPFQDFEL